MTVTLLRLVDGADQFVVHRATDYTPDIIVKKLDVPGPSIRARTEDRAGADGENDRTSHHGGRAVTLELDVFDTPMARVEQLGRYVHPATRPWLVIADDEWPQERALQLRAEPFSSPMDRLSNVHREVQLQWRVPDGVWVAWEPVSLLLPAENPLVRGRSTPTTFPRSYPPTGATGQTTHTNPGTTLVDQIVRLYGPCAGPRWSNDDTGESIIFSEQLVIPAGEYVEVNTRNRTAYYLSDPSASRLNYIDFVNNTWWRLRPGANRLRYHPVSGVDSGCAADLSYRPAWLLA